MPEAGIAPASEFAVELTGITKRFPGVVANSDVNLAVRRGEVHALCGENGAGKSTLMKILYGMQQPDEGTVSVDGQVVRFRSPSDAIKAGIGMVHQHFMLADNLTIAENVLLGAEASHGIGAAARRRITELAETVGWTADPDTLVELLGVADRQRVEILKVLYRGARTVILDEPTAVLVPQEVEELFDTVREMRADGFTFLFISHKLDEVRSIADAITVIRRGTCVGTVGPEQRVQPAAGRDDGRQRAAEPAARGVDGHRPGGARGVRAGAGRRGRRAAAAGRGGPGRARR